MSKTVGDYILKEKIGKGSYADVYKGTHKVTGGRFAIKTISKDILSEPKLLAGLESEIKIMREFKHENIVCLHEYFSSEKNFYLVLELCEGGDLSKFIKKKKRLDERLSHAFLTQITSGLAFLHERNFIHRDLKPANVLLSEFSDNAVLKLADFGFARQLTVASLAQTRCGTPLYMAPEILESKDYDGKADIWSVGCIFYEMLVGTSPFKGANEGDLLMNIKTKELNVPKDVSLSKVSVEILIKLLERHPMRRASLTQLVALCAHLTSSSAPSTARTGSNSASAPNDEAMLALPVPNPNEAKQQSASQEHSASDRTSQKGPFALPADDSDMMDPNFISPIKNAPSRAYAGGPAKGNLKGMFSPSAATAGTGATLGQDAYPAAAPQDKYNSPISTCHYHSQQQQSQQQASPQDPHSTSRRHQQQQSQQTSQQQLDPQFSKTLRAPYANVNNTPKYPSPSSSPPTTGVMSGLVAGFTGSYPQQQQPMQTSHSSVRSGQQQHSVAPSTSPASATIGMMGNLIAYVFNPSPTTNSMAESARTHSQQKQQAREQAMHTRTASLDRANPPNFGGNISSGTPPPGSSSNRSRDPQGRPTPVRENYFPPDPPQQQSDSGYNYSRNASSGHSVDDDFVFISKSSSDNDQRRPASDAKSAPSTNPSSNNSAYFSGVSAGSGENPMALPPPPPPLQQLKPATPTHYAAQLESEARAHEAAALPALYSSIVHKCEVYCAVVSSISSLGDQYVREAITPQQRQQLQAQQAQAQQKMDSSDAADDADDTESIAGFLQPSNRSRSGGGGVGGEPRAFQRQAVVDRYLVACSLYLHALSILTHLTKSFEVDLSMDKEQQLAGAMEKLKGDLRTVFDQLISRAESCQKQIDAIVNPDSDSNTGTLASKYSMPLAEPIMIQAAVKKEADAGMEELLGNLQLACKLYQQASELVEGVTLTAHDLGDQRKLQQYSTSLREKHDVCKKRAEDLLMYSS